LKIHENKASTEGAAGTAIVQETGRKDEGSPLRSNGSRSSEVTTSGYWRLQPPRQEISELAEAREILGCCRAPRGLGDSRGAWVHEGFHAPPLVEEFAPH
jgi:hypothetical protein